ncbi:MAG TPA: hypothetical protein VLL52_24130 [Anaerolineae bacterium]|nr:hypothetical protein [Anaerolineae bacterium]
MKKNLSLLGGILALTLLFVFFWNGFLRDQNPTTETDNNNGATGVTNLEADEASSLARLPGIQNMGGGGMGGGGGITANQAAPLEANMDMAATSIMMYNPWTEANLTYNGRFPAQPQVATVFNQLQTYNLSPEEAQRYADAFGMTGPLYTEIMSDFHVEEMGDINRIPASYHVFGDQYTFSIYGNNVQYHRNYNPDEINDINDMMPAAQAIPIAENFLRERGLLPADYTIGTSYGPMIEIREKINGYTNNMPTIHVQVRTDGTFQSININIWPQPESLGNYPLITAEEAWNLIQQTKDNPDLHSRVYFASFPSEEAMLANMQVVHDRDNETSFWQREYPIGTNHTLNTSIYGYKSVDGSAPPRLLAGRYQLIGSAETLNQLAEFVGHPLQLEGIIQSNGDEPTFEATSWTLRESFDDHPQFIYYQGTLQRDGDQTTFLADEGQTFTITDVPAAIADGDRIAMGGFMPTDGSNLFDWQHIDRMLWEMEEPMMEEPMIEPADAPSSDPATSGLAEPLPAPDQSAPVPVEPRPMGGGGIGLGNPNAITDITITNVELVYAPVYPSIELAVSSFAPPAEPTMIIQPAWRFTGTTNTGDTAEFIVQAVSPDFID